MIRSRRRRRIVGALATAALLTGGVWWASSGSTPLDDAGDDGYLGLRLLLERRGSTVSEIDGDDVDATTTERFDVVFVLRPADVDRDQLAQWHRYVAAGGHLVLGQPDRPAPSTTGTTTTDEVDRADRAENAADAAPVVDPGDCTIEGADGLQPVHTGGVGGHHVYSNERSCFGTTTSAIVTSAVCRAGTQVTLTEPTVFDNSTMGAPTDDRPRAERRGNALLAAALLAPEGRDRVGIVTGGVDTEFGDRSAPSPDEPRCGDGIDQGSIWQQPSPSPDERADGAPPSEGDGADGEGGEGDSAEGGQGDGEGQGDSAHGNAGQGGSGDGGSELPGGGIEQPGGAGSGGGTGGGAEGDGSGDDGAPTGAGTAEPPPTMFDFLSPGMKLALAQLMAVLAWYAWRRSRRRGVVVDDVVPVELRSSRRVEAVAAMRRRNGDVGRAAADLRDHTRHLLAAELGLGRDADVHEVAAAASRRTTTDVDGLTALLGPTPVRNGDELTELASRLHDLRTEVAATLTTTAPRR